MKFIFFSEIIIYDEESLEEVKKLTTKLSLKCIKFSLKGDFFVSGCENGFLLKIFI